MSLAKVHRAAKARKKWTCGKCKAEVQVGEPVLSFSVGFRGREQRRCDRPECYPTRAERESSKVADAYAAIDSVDLDSIADPGDFEATFSEVAEAFREVAAEYEDSEMFDRNQDLQERAEMLNSAADELEVWSLDESERPDEKDKSTWDGHESYSDAYDAWVDVIRDEARYVLEAVELP